MFKDLKPYPQRRDAGLPWLRQIPSGWDLVRAKSFLRPVDIRSCTGDEELLTVSSARGVVPRRGESVSMFAAASYVGHKLCWPDDLVINSLWAWGHGLGVTPFHGIVSSAYGVYRPDTRRVHPQFLHALVRSEPFQWELQVRSQGVWKSRLQLTDDRFFAAPVPLPPYEEQAAIVKYLGHAHRRIDRTIAAKRKMIALLEEQKQAIVNQAVTRGLDPTVPLMDTGIPWLGQIPAHWAAWPLGRAARIGNGSTPSRSEPLYWDSGTFPWLNSSNANREIVDSSDQYVTRKALAECHLPVVQPGSVLVAITGQGKTRGRAAVLEIPATINQHLAYVAPRQSVITAPYLQAAVGSAYGELRRISDDSGSTKGALTCQDLKSFRVPVPPLSEQTEIVELLGSSTKPTNAAMDRARREIDLLREFRTRLTADVVTGQLDVRDVAARLPELALDDLVPGAGDVDDDLEDEAAEFMEDAEA